MELKTRRGRGESVNSKFREDLLALLPFPEESAKNAAGGDFAKLHGGVADM